MGRVLDQTPEHDQTPDHDQTPMIMRVLTGSVTLGVEQVQWVAASGLEIRHVNALQDFVGVVAVGGFGETTHTFDAGYGWEVQQPALFWVDSAQVYL